MLWDIKLIFQAVGFGNIGKTVKREKLINSIQPKMPMTYLWFIGVDPSIQNHGIGSKLLHEIIEYSNKNNRPIYLETSTIKNLPWYEIFGFEVYNKQDGGNLNVQDFDTAMEVLKDYLEELFNKVAATDKDPKMDFARYPVTNSYEDHFYVGLLSNVEIDMENIWQVIVDVHKNFLQISNFLFWNELNNDW